jgi:hypothetical protein
MPVVVVVGTVGSGVVGTGSGTVGGTGSGLLGSGSGLHDQSAARTIIGHTERKAWISLFPIGSTRERVSGEDARPVAG